MSRDVTFADSHIDATTQAGSAANSAAKSKTAKYVDITATHVFMPIAIETAGFWNQQAIDAIVDIGRRISVITEEPLELFIFSSAFQLQYGVVMRSPSSFISSFDDD